MIIGFTLERGYASWRIHPIEMGHQREMVRRLFRRGQYRRVGDRRWGHGPGDQPGGAAEVIQKPGTVIGDHNGHRAGCRAPDQAHRAKGCDKRVFSPAVEITHDELPITGSRASLAMGNQFDCLLQYPMCFTRGLIAPASACWRH